MRILSDIYGRAPVDLPQDRISNKTSNALLIIAILTLGFGFIILRAAFPERGGDHRLRNFLIDEGTPERIASKIIKVHAIDPKDLALLGENAAAAVTQEIKEHRRKVIVGGSFIVISVLSGVAGLLMLNRAERHPVEPVERNA